MSFIRNLFGYRALAIAFLQDAKLIRSQVLCDTCDRYMSCNADPARSDGFRWRCFTRNAAIRCSRSLSIRDGSWFQQSNLTRLETMFLTYGIVYREQAHQLQSEYRFSPHTVADWGMLCREVMLSVPRYPFPQLQ
jgi:hypothetical protein